MHSDISLHCKRHTSTFPLTKQAQKSCLRLTSPGFISILRPIIPCDTKGPWGWGGSLWAGNEVDAQSRNRTLEHLCGCQGLCANPEFPITAPQPPQGGKPRSALHLEPSQWRSVSSFTGHRPIHVPCSDGWGERGYGSPSS